MSKKDFRKSLFTVKSPCSQAWDEMKGNDKVRFCEHCALEVNNISTMRRKDAVRMVRESDGRICIRYVKNPQTNAPVFADKLYQISRRAPILAAGVMTAALSLSSMTYAQGGISPIKDSTEQTVVSRQKDSKKDKTESPAASISGTILDPQGAVIPGIVVSLVAGNDSPVRTAASNEEGIYEFKNVAAGTYTLKADGAGGFADFQTEGLIVTAGNELKTDITMAVGAAYQTVGDISVVGYELPLLQAVSEGEPNKIKSLLVVGANVNGKDKNYDGITAMFVAVENGNIETVRMLLDFGAKINVRDEGKRTPLMRLDGDSTPELVKLLLSYGAKIKAIDKEGNNVLHHAAYFAKGEVLEILINEGANINAQNEEGKTPLMIAAEYENLEAVKALLDAGADVSLRDKENQTALQIALENDYKEIAELLNTFGGEK